MGFKRSKSKLGRELVILSLQKLAVLGYSLLLPLLILKNPASEIVAGWLLGHMACGLALGVIFMTTHLHDETQFVETDTDGVIQDSFARHILRTTVDVAPENALYTWLSGGLNLHVTHHLFPAISQVHLPALTRITRETAAEFGVPHYVTQRRPDLWKDPERFDPERFSPARKREIVKNSYFPFGLGPRVCIGQGLAMLEASIAISRIVSSFELLAVVGEKPQPNVQISLRMDRPLVLGLRPAVQSQPQAVSSNLG